MFSSRTIPSLEKMTRLHSQHLTTKSLWQLTKAVSGIFWWCQKECFVITKIRKNNWVYLVIEKLNPSVCFIRLIEKLALSQQLFNLTIPSYTFLFSSIQNYSLLVLFYVASTDLHYDNAINISLYFDDFIYYFRTTSLVLWIYALQFKFKIMIK